MPSVFDAEFASVAFPDLLDEFGEALTRHPLGVAASAASVTATFQEMEPQEFNERGQGVRRRAKITTDLALSALSVKDRWLRGSEAWETVSVTNVGPFRIVEAQRSEDEVRSGKSREVL